MIPYTPVFQLLGFDLSSYIYHKISTEIEQRWWMELLEKSSEEVPDTFLSFLTLLLREHLQAEAILWVSSSQITCHFDRKYSSFTHCNSCCSWECSCSHFRGWETEDTVQLLSSTAQSFQCAETCMHTKYRCCLFPVLTWTFCTQKGGAFAETVPLQTCSNFFLPCKAWPHWIPQYRSPAGIQDRRTAGRASICYQDVSARLRPRQAECTDGTLRAELGREHSLIRQSPLPQGYSTRHSLHGACRICVRTGPVRNRASNKKALGFTYLSSKWLFESTSLPAGGRLMPGQILRPGKRLLCLLPNGCLKG